MVQRYKTESKYYLIWDNIRDGKDKNGRFTTVAQTDGCVYRVLWNVDKTYYGWGCEIYGPEDRYSVVRKITKEEITSTGFKKFICILKSLFQVKRAYDLDSDRQGIPVKNEKNLYLYQKGNVILYKNGCTQTYNI